MQSVWNVIIHIYSKVMSTAKRLYTLHIISKLEAITLKNLAAQTIKLFMMCVTKHITQYRNVGHVKNWARNFAMIYEFKYTVLINEIIIWRKEHDKTRSRGMYPLLPTNYIRNSNFLTYNVILECMVGEASLTFWHLNLVTRYSTLLSEQNRHTAGYNHNGHLSIRNIHNHSKIKSQYLPFFTSTETSRTYNKLQLESSTCPTHGYFCISLFVFPISFILLDS